MRGLYYSRTAIRPDRPSRCRRWCRSAAVPVGRPPAWSPVRSPGSRPSCAHRRRPGTRSGHADLHRADQGDQMQLNDRRGDLGASKVDLDRADQRPQLQVMVQPPAPGPFDRTDRGGLGHGGSRPGDGRRERGRRLDGRVEGATASWSVAGRPRGRRTRRAPADRRAAAPGPSGSGGVGPVDAVAVFRQRQPTLAGRDVESLHDRLPLRVGGADHVGGPDRVGWGDRLRSSATRRGTIRMHHGHRFTIGTPRDLLGLRILPPAAMLTR